MSRPDYISVDDALKRLQWYCVRQDRCHQEVRSKLIDLGIYGTDLEWIMAELINENFLNEERFARSFARGKFRMKKWGKNRILQELKRRQISDYCLKKAMEEIDEEDYHATLESLLEKKMHTYREGNPAILQKKLAHFAINKGYESNLVWPLVRQITNGK